MGVEVGWGLRLHGRRLAGSDEIAVLRGARNARRDASEQASEHRVLVEAFASRDTKELEVRFVEQRLQGRQGTSDLLVQELAQRALASPQLKEQLARLPWATGAAPQRDLPTCLTPS